MEIQATEIKPETIAPSEVLVGEDLQAKFDALEAEKNKLTEEKENYRKAYLKEADRNKTGEIADESDDDKIRRIARETIEGSRLLEIAKEQDDIIKKTLKENKELKAAHLNKGNVPASPGSHGEGPEVKSTQISAEQLAHFKSRGWDDKKIEAYKKNLARRP